LPRLPLRIRTAADAGGDQQRASGGVMKKGRGQIAGGGASTGCDIDDARPRVHPRRKNAARVSVKIPAQAELGRATRISNDCDRPGPDPHWFSLSINCVVV
jgi:hypothetical protein